MGCAPSYSPEGRLVIRQWLHNAEQFVFGFEPHTGNLRQLDVAVFDRYPIGKSAKRLKDSRIGFVASQPQTGGNVQRHLMSSVRNTAIWRPSMFFQHAQYSYVLDQSIAQCAVELQDVAIRPQLRVANEISRVLQ